MKSMATKILALTAALFGLQLSAATPVAVWDGDFTTTTKGGYTLNLNGNSLNDGVITINQSKGVTVDWTTAMYDTGMTVLFKYSDLTLDSQKTIATSCINSDKTGDRTGVYLHYNNTPGNPDGIWATTSRYDTEASRTTMTSSQLSGTFAFTYKGGSGTYLYRVANGARTTVFGCAKLNSYEDKNIYGCAVGGPRTSKSGSTGFAAATGLKISAIAVFSGVLSEAEMKAYKWPTELSKMYSNRLSTGNVVVPAATYGAITVSGWGYKATAFASATDLSNTASGEEVTGSHASIIQKVSGDGDVRSHTLSGWFCPNSLSAETMLWWAYSKGFTTYNNNGYKVSVTTDGKIKVVRTSQNAADNGTAIYSSEAVMSAGMWAHVAVAMTWGGSGNRTLTPVLYVNGVKKTLTSGTIASDVSGGENGATVRIGAGVSAAGIYVDNTALYDSRAVVKTATGYVVQADKEFMTTISQGTTFENITWQEGAFVASDHTIATITVSGAASEGEVDITFNDPTVALKSLKLVGSRDVRLVAASALSNVASIDRTGLTGKLTYAWPVSALPMTDANIYYGAGAGSEQAHASISITANKYLNLRGTTPFYLGTTAGESATPYTMTFKDATVYCKGWSGLAVGQATVTVEGSSTVSTERVILSQGRNGLASALVVKDTASVTSTGTTDADENTNSVMFGHWNGPSTFTLQDSATFTSASQVLVGKTGNNQTINIQGGTFTAKGIKASGNATGSNAINLSGGKLVLGSLGITSYSSTTIPVNVTGNATIEASAKMMITQTISLGSGKALTLTAPANVSMTALGVISGAGSIVKEGAGSVVLSGDNTYSGGTTISEGVLTLGSASALGTGAVTIGANGQLDLNGKSVTISSLAGSGTIYNSSLNTAHINGIPVDKGISINLTDGKIRIVLGADETLTLSSMPPNGTVAIGGAGKVAYTTSATAPAYPTWTWIAEGDDAWTGTYALTGFTTATKDACGENGWDLRPYYNGTNSVFEIVGSSASATVEGYFNNVSISVGELVLNGAIKIVNGYSNYTYAFTKISGSKAFTINTGSTAIAATIKVADISEFTGTLSNQSPKNSENNKCYCVIVGDGTLPEGYKYDMSSIYFTGDTTLNMVTLSAVNGVKVNGDAVVTVLASKMPTCNSGTMMTFENGSSIVLEDANDNTKLIANGGISVAEGVTIPVTIADAKDLAANKVCITWPSKPTGDFSLVASGVAAGQTGFKASKNMYTLLAIADASTTYYEVEGGETTTFDNAWLETAGVKEEGSTTAEVQANLNGTNANGIKMSDVYLMGYEAKDAQTAAVILKPDQAQSNGETISLSVAGVPNTTRNGAVVTYTAQASASRKWENPTEKAMDTLSVDMALPTSGVLYYRVQATVALP